MMSFVAIFSQRSLRPHSSLGLSNIQNSAGFSLLELALALVVIGSMVMIGAGAYLNAFQVGGGRAVNEAQLALLSEQVIEFAKTRNRLPCPDRSGDGFESRIGEVCESGLQVAYLPYLSMGIAMPPIGKRALYGVSRDPDLTALLNQAQMASAGARAAIASQVYVTGDGSTSNGVENCGSNIAYNPAFVLLVPGEDRSGDGKSLDGIHSSLPAAPACFAAPTIASSGAFDDRTATMNFYSLMARLN